MANLPPRPGDALPPRLARGTTSPRAASMRDDPIPREREDWRRRSPPPSRRFSPPRPDSRRWSSKDDDRYKGQPSWKTREWDDWDRERSRHRTGRDRIAIDTYRPDARPSSRRHSPHPHNRHRTSRSPRQRERDFRSPSPRRSPRHPSSPKRSKRSASPRPRAQRSRSPPRHRVGSPPCPRRPNSPEPHTRLSERNVSPHPDPPTRRHERSRGENHRDGRSSRSKSRAVSEVRGEETDFPREEHRERSRSHASMEPPLVDDTPQRTQIETIPARLDAIKEEIKPSTRKLPVHPPPSGPRRPRTPTGPRARSPALSRRDSLDDGPLRREDKGKGKEISQENGASRGGRKRDRSRSLPRGPRKRAARSWSRSRSGALSRSSRSRSRSKSRPSSPSHSQRSISERASPHVLRRDRDKNERRFSSIDELIHPLKPRVSKTLVQDAELKRIKENRIKLDEEHANVMRAVRRAQHELDVAQLEQKSAEERLKAAHRVHERSVKGFLTPAT